MIERNITRLVSLVFSFLLLILQNKKLEWTEYSPILFLSEFCFYDFFIPDKDIEMDDVGVLPGVLSSRSFR